ncbi:MAG: class II glutamine amidotransferase [Alphaproteobacteria bacterium]
MFTIPPLTSDVIGISLDGLSSPSINVNLSDMINSSHSRGWGFGWYPGDQQSAMVVKDPVAHGVQALPAALSDWSIFRSTVFFFKVRGAAKGYTHNETQPFLRSFAGRDWMFMHNGDLDKLKLEKLHGRKRRLLEPLGSTDSELAFCNLLMQMQEGAARQLSDLDPEMLHSWFRRFDALGSSDMYLTDGLSIAFFQGSRSPKQLSYARIQPPENQGTYESEAAHLTLNDPRDSYRTALIVSSSRFSSGVWTPMQPGQMIIARRGSIFWDSAAGHANPAQVSYAPIPRQQAPQGDAFMAPMQAEQTSQSQAQAQVLTNARSIITTPQGETLSYRKYEVTHATHYEYSEPVDHSTHVFRLQPTDDSIQEVVRSSISISTSSEEIQYEDVFGNQVIHCVINVPFSKLSVEATSIVNVYATPPDNHSLSARQTTLPLAWMPWQRQMMMPYLLPSELPESQLLELTKYATSFVERNNNQLLRTIEDINLSIYRDYKYVPGATALSTTPFEVFSSREGVCQDFANLFICLARLLSIPARYRMGYIYTGASYANKIQSDASHAWVEVYLPYIGWRGFDPTNGCIVAQDHIRVACGRNYGDASPTSGTIYRGGGAETLTVEVRVKELLDYR